jgi:hypothetical protein
MSVTMFVTNRSVRLGQNLCYNSRGGEGSILVSGIQTKDSLLLHTLPVTCSTGTAAYMVSIFNCDSINHLEYNIIEA